VDQKRRLKTEKGSLKIWNSMDIYRKKISVQSQHQFFSKEMAWEVEIRKPERNATKR